MSKVQKSKITPKPGDWLDVLAPNVINQYIGKHIAIIHKRVVASGSSYDEVLAGSQLLFPDETPYLAYIPTSDEAADEETAAVASSIGQFAGKYVAVVDKSVVAFGFNREEVLKEASGLFPGAAPYIVYIPRTEEADSDQIADLILSIASGSGETSRERARLADPGRSSSVSLK